MSSQDDNEKTDFDKIQTLIEHLFDDSENTKEEYFIFFKKFLEFVKDIREKNKTEREELRTLATNLVEDAKNKNTLDINQMKEEAIKEIMDVADNVELKLMTIKSGKDGKTPKKGVDYFDGINPRVEDVVEDVLVKIKVPSVLEIVDNIPIVGEKVRDALELLIGKERLDKTAIRGLEEIEKKVNDFVQERGRVGWGAHPLQIQFDGEVIDKVARILNFKGSGVADIVRNKDGSIDITISGGSGSGLTKETPTGDIDDVNLEFNVDHEPFFINVNGAIYEVGDGAYASYALGVITLAYPVGTGGFIKSYY